MRSPGELASTEVASWSAQRGMSPSQMVQELLWKTIREQHRSLSERRYITIAQEDDSIFKRMNSYIIALAALNTKEQSLTWMYILIAYCQLEFLALDLLRLHKGENNETFWRNPHKLPTLYQAACELERKQLATQEMIQILKAVANLRNSVAHKQIIGGMTTHASYGNRHIFDDDYVTKYFNEPDSHISGVDENTPTQLMTDITRATNLLSQLPHAVLNDGP